MPGNSNNNGRSALSLEIERQRDELCDFINGICVYHATPTSSDIEKLPGKILDKLYEFKHRFAAFNCNAGLGLGHYLSEKSEFFNLTSALEQLDGEQFRKFLNSDSNHLYALLRTIKDDIRYNAAKVISGLDHQSSEPRKELEELSSKFDRLRLEVMDLKKMLSENSPRPPSAYTSRVFTK